MRDTAEAAPRTSPGPQAASTAGSHCRPHPPIVFVRQAPWPAAKRRIPVCSVGHIPLGYAASLRPWAAWFSRGQTRPY